MTARRIWLSASVSMTLLAVLLIGFCGYAFGLSNLQEERSQSTTYKDFSKQLREAVAPVTAAKHGVALAVLDIPSIGLDQAVVVEGTTSSDLTRGPGHLPSSVFPGQNGVTVLFGRRNTFGAPFARLGALRLGDQISVTTGQGRFTYIVNTYGDSTHPIRDQALARMVLVTSNAGWVPSTTVLVGARLDGTPADTSAQLGAVSAADRPLASDNDALEPLQLWSLALLIVAVLAGVGVLYWNRWATYIALGPVIAALAWCVFEATTMVLPNLY